MKLSKYIVDSLVSNNYFEDLRQPLTYNLLDKMRQPKYTLSLDKALENFKKIVKLKNSVSTEESEEFVLLAYMEKTGIYSKIRDILYDIYYGKKYPNPLSRICMKIEMFNKKYSDIILSKSMIEEELYRNDMIIQEGVNAGRKIPNYYSVTNQECIDLELPPMYGLYNIVKSLPVQNMGLILMYIGELNWRNVCPSAGDGITFEDTISISFRSLFFSPELFGIQNTVIELNHDFYYEESNLTQAIQSVSSIVFKCMSTLDEAYLTKKIIPIGIYEDSNPLEAFITFNDMSNGLTSRTGLMELMIKTMNKGKSVHVKYIAVINNKGEVDFKLFKINLNVLLIDGSSIFSSKKELDSSDYLRVFTRPKDCAYFNTYVPFNKLQVLNVFNKEMEESAVQSKLLESLMLDTVYAMIEDNKEKVISNVSVMSNRMLYIHRLGEKYDLLYQLTYIIQSGGLSTSVSWAKLDISVVNKYFNDFYQLMIKEFADYESIHLDGLLNRILNLHKFVYNLFQNNLYIGKDLEYIWDKAKWIQLRSMIGHIKDMLEAMSNYLRIVSRIN